MTEAEELEKIEDEIAELGRQIEAKRDRALEILCGRIGVVRGTRFRIDRAYPRFGGSSCRLFFSGPALKQNGEPHARNGESAPLGLFDSIEPRAALTDRGQP
jgi:hypothetical protein